MSEELAPPLPEGWTARRNTSKRSLVKIIYTKPNGQDVCSKELDPPRYFCKVTAIMTNGRCKVHGGAVPAGDASPHYEGKGYSAYLPERMLDDYQQTLASKDLLNLEDDIALARTRVKDLLKRVDTGEAAQKWVDSLYWWQMFKTAQGSHDKKMLAVALDNLDRLLSDGQQDAMSWREAMEHVELVAKLTNVQTKNLKNKGLMVTLQKVRLVIDALLSAVLDEIGHDKAARSRIVKRFAQIVGGVRWQ